MKRRLGETRGKKPNKKNFNSRQFSKLPACHIPVPMNSCGREISDLRNIYYVNRELQILICPMNALGQTQSQPCTKISL